MQGGGSDLRLGLTAAVTTVMLAGAAPSEQQQQGNQLAVPGVVPSIGFRRGVFREIYQVQQFDDDEEMRGEETISLRYYSSGVRIPQGLCSLL